MSITSKLLLTAAPLVLGAAAALPSPALAGEAVILGAIELQAGQVVPAERLLEARSAVCIPTDEAPCDSIVGSERKLGRIRPPALKLTVPPHALGARSAVCILTGDDDCDSKVGSKLKLLSFEDGDVAGHAGRSRHSQWRISELPARRSEQRSGSEQLRVGSDGLSGPPARHRRVPVSGNSRSPLGEGRLQQLRARGR